MEGNSFVELKKEETSAVVRPAFCSLRKVESDDDWLPLKENEYFILQVVSSEFHRVPPSLASTVKPKEEESFYGVKNITNFFWKLGQTFEKSYSFRILIMNRFIEGEIYEIAVSKSYQQIVASWNWIEESIMKVLLSDWKILEGTDSQLDHSLKSNWLLNFFKKEKYNLPLSEWEIPSPRNKIENNSEKNTLMTQESTQMMKLLSTEEKYAVGVLISFVSQDWSDENLRTLLQKLISQLLIGNELEAKLLSKEFTVPEPGPFASLIPQENRLGILLYILYHSISNGRYDSRVRVALQKISNVLSIEWDIVMKEEDSLAKYLQSMKDDGSVQTTSGEKYKSSGRWWKIGLGTVLGGTAFALSGGLAAPAILGALSTLGSFASGVGITLGLEFVVSGAGAMAVMTGLFGVAGGGLSAYKVAKRTLGISEFKFERIIEKNTFGNKPLGMRTLIGISGWMEKGEDVIGTWSSLLETYPFGDHYSILWESQYLINLGTVLREFVSTTVAAHVARYWASVTITTVASAITWPLTALSALSIVDSPWYMVAAEKCGKLLASILMEGHHGNRPVSFIGFSMASRLIFYCLEELAAHNAYGIVENVFMLGSPVTNSPEIKKVVAGRLVSGYTKKDWLLAYLYRAAHLSIGVAGLEPVEVEGVENVDLTSIVDGHFKYKEKLPEILKGLNLDDNLSELSLSQFWFPVNM